MADVPNQSMGSSMDEQKKRDNQSQGGQAGSQNQDIGEIGKKGGRTSQQSGGQFQPGSERAREAGKMGGSK